MSILADFSDVLHTYDVQAIKLVPQDHGRPPTVEPQSARVPISGQEQTSKEAIAAGVEAGREFMKLFSGPDLDPNITKKHTLRMWDESGQLAGDWNVRSRRQPERAGHIEIECDRLNTQ